MPYPENEKEVIAVSLAFLLCAASHNIRRLQSQRKSSARRKKWARRLLKERDDRRHSSTLLPMLQNYDPELYTNYLRMLPYLFQQLLAQIGPSITKRHNNIKNIMPPEVWLQITLRYLATGEDFKSLQYQFHVGEGTIGKIIEECCQTIWKCLEPKHMKCPQSAQDWLKVEEGFEKRWHLPHCLGAISGKHIRMQKLKVTESKNILNKVLITVTDSNYRFIYIDIGSYGSEGDSGILYKSQFGQSFLANNNKYPPPSQLQHSNSKYPHFFVADQNFPLKTDLLRPYKGKDLPKSQMIFNYRLYRASNVAENSFGILTNRFRVLRNELSPSRKTTACVIKAALALHNFLIDEKCPDYCSPELVDHELVANDYLPVNGKWRNDGTPVIGLYPLCRQGSTNATRLAAVNRDELANYLLYGGCVQWQDTAVQNGYYI